MSKTLDKHFAAIKAGNVDKTNVIGLRKAINNYERGYAGWSMSNTAITMEERNAIDEMLSEHMPRVIGELHDTGIAILTNKRYAKRLSDVQHIVGDLDHFTLVGYDCIDGKGLRFTPVYRAHNTQGQSFPFRNIAWQSGGDGPEIVSANYY